MNFSNKICIVTGGAGGIGLCIVNFDDNYESKHSLADKHQHPVRRVGKPLDIVRVVIFLCDEENGFITGENITVDGGMTKQMIYSGDYGWEYVEP